MRTLLTLSLAAGAVVAVPAAAHAAAKPPKVCKATFTDRPESGAGWALDTFTRFTTFKSIGDGRWKVAIIDGGHFVTVPGKPSDGDNSVLIEHQVKGKFFGGGEYTVVSDVAPACVPNEHYDGTAGPTTGKWPLHYFGENATTSGIDPWRWIYKTKCEHMLEDSVKGVVGNITGKLCRQKPTPKPTPKPSETTPAPPDEAPAPTPVDNDLPVTG